jgi:hypothetical protein
MNTPELALNTPADLLAALPHLLGFVPTDDLVALLLGHAGHHDDRVVAMRAAIRCPLTIDRQAAERFPQACGLDADHYPAAILAAVCDTGRHEHARMLLRTVRAALHRCGIVVHRMLITRSVTEPGHWIDLDTGHTGTTTAYTDSAATALGVMQGRVIAASRDQIQREFTTTDPAPAMDAEAQDIVTLADATVTDLHHAITRNRPPTPDLAMRAALVVTAHIGLRDALLRLAASHELVSGRLWTQIAAAHRGCARAELLTMAAVAYYCGEDTVRAGIALTHAAAAAGADDSAPPRLAVMLNTALRAGMPPSKIRDIIVTQRTAPIQKPHI